MRSAQLAFAIATVLFAVITPAAAAELQVQADELAQMTPDEQAKLIEQMKAKSLLDKDDTVVNSSSGSADKSVGSALLLTLAPKACKLIAATKRDEDLKACLADKDEAKQATCKTAVEERFSTIDTVCGLIKLF